MTGFYDKIDDEGETLTGGYAISGLLKFARWTVEEVSLLLMKEKHLEVTGTNHPESLVLQNFRY